MVLATVGAGNLYVEDGTGYENADTYVSIDFADTYLQLFSKTSSWHTADILDKAAALRRATFEWAEGYFQGRWRGTIEDRTTGSPQRLSWPRIGAYDDDGRTIQINTVPIQIQEAVSLVANDIINSSLSVLPSSTQTTGDLIRETRKGAGFEKTQEWSSNGGSSIDSSLIVFRAAEALVFPLLRGANEGGVYRS